jgi:hypothetical protein
MLTWIMNNLHSHRNVIDICGGAVNKAESSEIH